MVTYSNSTTARLEGFARARGRDLGILISPDNSAGRYFVTYDRDTAELCHPWWALGWTVTEAQNELARIAAGEEKQW